MAESHIVENASALHYGLELGDEGETADLRLAVMIRACRRAPKLPKALRWQPRRSRARGPGKDESPRAHRHRSVDTAQSARDDSGARDRAVRHRSLRFHRFAEQA